MQIAAETTIGALLSDAGLGPVVRREEMKEEPFSNPRMPLCVILLNAGPAEIWLYDDTLSYKIGGKGDYLERLDYPSDEAIIAAASAAISKALASGSRAI